MIDFDFQIKTKIYFGKGKENLVGEILKKEGASKIVLVVGQNSVFSSGLFDKVTKLLSENKIDFLLIKGVRANPEADLIRNNISAIKAYKPDYILAIGGGSVIDTAKLISVAYYYDGDCFDFNLHKVIPTKALPIATILTISAAGSEMSTSCVIQDDQTNIKSGFNSELVRPAFSIENPELTFSVSKNQTGNGIVDIMMHTLERYFMPSGEFETADGFSLELLEKTIKSGTICINDPKNYEARANQMLMSSLSHCGLTNIGKKFGMPVHQLEHALSGVYPFVVHGAGLSVLFPAWAKYYYKYDIEKFAILGERLFNLHMADKLKEAEACVSCFKEFFKEIGMPISFKDLGIENPDIDLLTSVFSDGGTRVVAHPKEPMDCDVAHKIYELCL